MRYKTYWMNQSGFLEVLDQTALPFFSRSRELRSVEDVVEVIRSMVIRGAGTIAGVAAYGVALAYNKALSESSDPAKAWAAFEKDCSAVRNARPTAVNLMWATDRMTRFTESLRNGKTPVMPSPPYLNELKAILGAGARPGYISALTEALAISDEDVIKTEAVGQFGLEIIKKIHDRKVSEGKDGTVNILTHCNAGWLGIVNSGTAMAPMYAAKKAGIPVHVWVDETRPRNQGSLTSWELTQDAVPHTVIADNTGGLLMMLGRVDMAITGADRVTRCGDTANKIGTYLKALAAKANHIPFYVALPAATFDLDICSGLDIPIEERSPEEVLTVTGLDQDGKLSSVRVYPEGTQALNYGFDITPASLITGLITEKGVCEANEESIVRMLGSS